MQMTSRVDGAALDSVRQCVAGMVRLLGGTPKDVVIRWGVGGVWSGNQSGVAFEEARRARAPHNVGISLEAVTSAIRDSLV